MQAELRELLDKQAIAERTIVFDWSRPADETNWWDAPGNPPNVGAHGPADPAWRFLDAEANW